MKIVKIPLVPRGALHPHRPIGPWCGAVWRLVFTCAAHARGKAGRATKGGRNHRLCAGDGPVLDVLRFRKRGLRGFHGDEWG